MPYPGDGEVRDCIIHATCNVVFLLLDKVSLAYKVIRLHRRITLASASSRLHIKGISEVSNLLKLGHLGPVFQNVGDIFVSSK